MFLWEFATSVAGTVLDNNPFDQPDVQSAKDATKKVLASGSLPKVLTRVHPVYRTPVNTIILQWLVNLVTGLLLLWWLGVVNGYFYEIFVVGLAVLIVYAMGNIGVFFLYWRQYRSEFNIFYHVIFPVLSLAALTRSGILIRTAASVFESPLKS